MYTDFLQIVSASQIKRFVCPQINSKHGQVDSCAPDSSSFHRLRGLCTVGSYPKKIEAFPIHEVTAMVPSSNTAPNQEFDDPLILIHEKKISSIYAGLKVCAIKAPGFGENRKASIQDLAVLTGDQLITEEFGMNLEKVDLNMLGTCKKTKKFWLGEIQ